MPRGVVFATELFFQVDLAVLEGDLGHGVVAQPLHPDAEVGLEAPALEVEVRDVREVRADIHIVRRRGGSSRADQQRENGEHARTIALQMLSSR